MLTRGWAVCAQPFRRFKEWYSWSLRGGDNAANVTHCHKKSHFEALLCVIMAGCVYWPSASLHIGAQYLPALRYQFG